MWGQTPEEIFRRRAEREGRHTDLHNVAFPGQFSQDTTAVQSPHDSPSPERREAGGTWGERDVGGPVNREEAMLDFEGLQRQLSHVSTKTRESDSRPKLGMWRTLTGGRATATRSRTQPARRTESTATPSTDKD